MKKQISPRLACLIFSILVICFAIGFYTFAAWQEPTQPQPGGNVPAPVNISDMTQLKAGGLGIGGLFVTYDETYLAVDSGNVGIGTTSPGEKLEVAGQVKITGASPGPTKTSYLYIKGEIVSKYQTPICPCDKSSDWSFWNAWFPDCSDFFKSSSDFGPVCYDQFIDKNSREVSATYDRTIIEFTPLISVQAIGDICTDQDGGVCLTEAAAEYKFGGMYTLADGNTCHKGNPYAGGECECPPGYEATLIYADPNYNYWDGWVYFCGK